MVQCILCLFIRMDTARCRAEVADKAASRARAEAELARLKAKEYQHIPLVLGNVYSRIG